MTFLLQSVWASHPGALDPVDVLREVHISMERGTVPAEQTRKQFVRGLDRYFAGSGDLATCLGLRARQGRCNEEPRRRVAQQARAALIHEAMVTHGGSVSCASAEWLSRALRGMAPVPAQLEPHVVKLRQLKGVKVALSSRQLFRIAKEHASAR